MNCGVLGAFGKGLNISLLSSLQGDWGFIRYRGIRESFGVELGWVLLWLQGRHLGRGWWEPTDRGAPRSCRPAAAQRALAPGLLSQSCCSWQPNDVLIPLPRV